MEGLRRRGVIPETIPILSAERQAELKRLGGSHGAIDTSHLRRTPSLDRANRRQHPLLCLVSAPSWALSTCLLRRGACSDQKLLSSSELPINRANTSKARFTTWLPLAIARWAPR